MAHARRGRAGCGRAGYRDPARRAAGVHQPQYERDDEGQWFFQNGPQRVYVELAYTPWVVRLTDMNGTLRRAGQTGAAFEPAYAWIDDAGGILFSDEATPPRVAALHDHDIDLFANHATLLDDEGRDGVFHWRDGVDLALQPIPRDAVGERFSFVASPAKRAGTQTR